MKLEAVAECSLEDAIKELGKDSTKYKIVEQSLDTGIEHIKMVCAEYENNDKMTRRQMVKNRRKAKQDAYDFLYNNTPATSESVGMGPIAGFVFWFVLKQALWWLAGKLINYFLFDDEGDD
jgi:hypothetical protein